MTTKRKQLILAWYDLIPPKDVDGIWGKQSKEATMKLQSVLGIEQDGDFGPTTAAEALSAIFEGNELVFDAVTDNNVGGNVDADNPYQHWWEEIEFFDPDEMKCKCMGKYCNGFPHEIQPLLMQILDRARRWSGHPIQVISGLRCETHNRNEKGHANSQHMYGEAVDVYFYGVSANAALAWLQSQPDVRYAYRIEGCNNIHFDIQPVGR